MKIWSAAVVALALAMPARGQEGQSPEPQPQQGDQPASATQPSSATQPAPATNQQAAPSAQPSKPVRVFESPETPPAQSGEAAPEKAAPEKAAPEKAAQAKAAASTASTASRRKAVEMIRATAPDKSVLAARKSSYSFKVTGGEWVDTGVTVAAGDRLVLKAEGSMDLDDGRKAGPEGVSRGWKDLIRQFDANNANVGAVVGRIGDAGVAVPFLVGNGREVDVTQAGHLFLAANLSSDVTGKGSFEVKLKLSPPEAAKATAAATKSAAGPAAASNLEALLSPALFADIPRRVCDQQGNPGDMVNFALLGTEDQLKNAFKAAGWVAVDKTPAEAVLHGLLATLSHEAYVEMPMSTLYLFGRSQDMSFARAAPVEVAAVRHHLRVWKTEKIVDGRQLWVGSATHDNGFEKDERNGKVTHHIDPNIDEERDFIEKSFSAAGALSGAAYVLPENPLTTARTATGGSFHSDGRIVVLLLAGSAGPSPTAQ